MQPIFRFSALICLAVAGFGGGAVSANELFQTLDTSKDALASYRWENRPVILLAPSPHDPSYRQAISALEAVSSDLRERDIVVLSDVSPDDPSALRDRLAPPGFMMLLIGKDGGIKLRSDSVISLETLKETIDAMPMRKREMREE